MVALFEMYYIKHEELKCDILMKPNIQCTGVSKNLEKVQGKPEQVFQN